METKTQILFLLSTFGSINGLLMAAYFFVKKPYQRAHILLGLTLTMISLRTLKSAIYYFNSNMPDSLLQIGMMACFMIGPFLFFYASDTQGSLKKHWMAWKVHLFGLIGFIVCFGLLYPRSKDPDLWRELYTPINLVWLFYNALALWVLRDTLKMLFSKKTDVKDEIYWPLCVVIGCFLIWLAYFTIQFTSYIFAAASLTVLFALGFLYFLFTRAARIEEKYQGKKIEPRTADLLGKRLERIMAEEEIFRDPNLTLPRLSKKVGVSAPMLSQFLNDNMNMSFPRYLQEYRVSAVQECLVQGGLKMEAIVEQCGFNSKSTLYAAFKTVTGTTPAKYLQDVK